MRRRAGWVASVAAALVTLITLVFAPRPAGAQADARLLEALGLPQGASSGTGAPAVDYGLPDVVRGALAPIPGTGLPSTALQDGPIDPARYRLGPGDELLVNYRGKTSVTHRLTILPEGGIYLPDVGAVPLAGLTLAEGRRAVRAAAQKILNSIAIDVQLAQVRSFKVAIRGEVRRPGSYAVNGATRLLELIQMAGGAGDSAAIRSIRLADAAAAGAVGTSTDLLPFLLGKGDESSNPYLRDGVTVFVPRRQRSVLVLGSVTYPGRYDLPDAETTVGALLALVGLRPDAVTDRIEFVDFGAGSGAGSAEPRSGTLDELSATALHDGARLLVPGSGDYRRADVVFVEGEVRFPGAYLLGAGGVATPLELIARAGGFSDQAVTARVRLVRVVPPDTMTSEWRRLAQFPQLPLTSTERERLHARGGSKSRVVQLDLSRREGESAGMTLAAGDRLVVPRSTGAVEVAGRVKRPGFYPYRAGAAFSDYIAAAGGAVSHAEMSRTRLTSESGDGFLLAKDAPEPRPGDRIWVPERPPRNGWAIIRDAVIVAGQVATIYLVIHQSTK